jgi:flagellar motor switch protein FliG
MQRSDEPVAHPTSANTPDPDGFAIAPMKRVDPASVARRLKAEHPQIIAALLVRLDIALAADVLKIFPEALRNHIVLRIATLQGIRPAAMKDLHDVLLFVLAAPQSASQTAFGGIAAAGKIINQLGVGIEEAVMAAIRDHDPDLAGAIRARLAAIDKARISTNGHGNSHGNVSGVGVTP